MESPYDRTETHAVVDSNIQAPSEVFLSLSHGILTVMHLQADCRRRTTNSTVTVTVTVTAAVLIGY